MLMPPLRSQTTPAPQTPLETALRACAGSLVLVFVYGCSYNLLLLAPSIYLLQIYDRVLSSRSADTLLMLTLIVAFAVVIGGVLDALRRAVLGRIGAWLDDRLRPSVLSACFEYAYRSDPARASEAYRDLTTLRQFAESGACPMLFDVLWSPLFLFVLFLVHPLLGVIGAATALLVFGLGFAGERLTEGPLARSVAALTRSHGRFGLAVGNVHVIKAMGMIEGAARLVQAGGVGCEARARGGSASQRIGHADLQAGARRGAGSDHGRRRLARARTEPKPRHHLCHQSAVRTCARADRRCDVGLESLRDGAIGLSAAQRRHGCRQVECECRRFRGTTQGKPCRQQCRRCAAGHEQADARRASPSVSRLANAWASLVRPAPASPRSARSSPEYGRRPSARFSSTTPTSCRCATRPAGASAICRRISIYSARR